MVKADAALEEVLRRAERNGWAGADPYDGLLSGIGKTAIPLGSMARMAIIQATLRSPAFRTLAKPPASINPKGLGLFLGAVRRGTPTLGADRAAQLGTQVLDLIPTLAVREGTSAAWGY